MFSLSARGACLVSNELVDKLKPHIEELERAYPEARDSVQQFRIDDKELLELIPTCEKLCKRAHTTYDIAVMMKAFEMHTGPKNKEKLRSVVVSTEGHLKSVSDGNPSWVPEVLWTQMKCAKLFKAATNA